MPPLPAPPWLCQLYLAPFVALSAIVAVYTGQLISHHGLYHALIEAASLPYLPHERPRRVDLTRPSAPWSLRASGESERERPEGPNGTLPLDSPPRLGSTGAAFNVRTGTASNPPLLLAPIATRGLPGGEMEIAVEAPPPALATAAGGAVSSNPKKLALWNLLNINFQRKS